ncbi:MAG: hypothetical protein N2747_10120 [Chitinophagaceae bacterium]|nr:hypothetical protein [Chitinophagaceae bacterium]
MKFLNYRQFVFSEKWSRMSDAELREIDRLLNSAESDSILCQSFELATRWGITHNRKKILKALKHTQTPPFSFLINKN